MTWYAAYSGALLAVAAVGATVSVVLLAMIGTTRCLDSMRRKLYGCFRRNGFIETALVCAVVVTVTMYGGSKPVSITANMGADPGIGIAYATVDTTNVVETVGGVTTTNSFCLYEIGWTNGTAGISTPFYGHNNPTDDWQLIEKLYPVLHDDVAPGSTNVLTFWTAGTSRPTLFWFGSNPPRTIIDTGGVDIVFFLATSTAVTMRWTCGDANYTSFDFQMRERAERDSGAWGPWTTWATCEAGSPGSTNEVSITGFTVGKTREYRIRGEYRE